jgi:hypothetical protein
VFLCVRSFYSARTALTEKFSMVLGHSEGKSFIWMSPRDVRNTASLQEGRDDGKEGSGEGIRYCS